MKKRITALAAAFLLWLVPSSEVIWATTREAATFAAPIATGSLKWAALHGEGWTVSPTPPTLFGDCIYLAAGTQLKKLHKETGQTLQTAELSNSVGGYSMQPVGTGDGKIFVPLANGRIECFDAESMQPLWKSEPIGIAYTPITYHDGYIYSGTWDSETRSGFAFCLSTRDENTEKTDEIKSCTWKKEHRGGFYSAGAFLTDAYAVFGSDNGTEEATDTSLLYSVNPRTGETLDTLELIGDMRACITFADNTLYFPTKGGIFYAVPISADGIFGTPRTLSLSAQSTAQPIVYNGRAYLGTADGKMHVIDLSAMEVEYAVAAPGYPQGTPLLCTEYEEATGKIFVFFTYNATPGGIYVLADAPTQTEPIAYPVFTPTGEMANWCLSNILTDETGTLYYKNDSGYIFAVSDGGPRIIAFENGTLTLLSAKACAVPILGAVYGENMLTDFSAATVSLSKGFTTYTPPLTATASQTVKFFSYSKWFYELKR